MFSVLLKTLAALCTLYCAHGYDSRGGTSRILGGDDVQIDDFPYYAGLWNCGAAILSDRWVITAAHCVSDNVPVEQIWVGGESFRNSKKVKYDQVIIHPGVNLPNELPRNDIALLRLAEPLEFTDKIQPIDLPSGKPSKESQLAFVGRGIDESGRLSRGLKKMDVQRLTTQQCLSYIPNDIMQMIKPNLSILEKAILCAMRTDEQPGICSGDSGSPLVQGNILIGLASFIGNIDGRPDEVVCDRARLGFYVNVASYVPWIKSVTGLK